MQPGNGGRVLSTTLRLGATFPLQATGTDFMQYFANRYRFDGLERPPHHDNRAAHHRFTNIHPSPTERPRQPLMIMQWPMRPGSARTVSGRSRVGLRVDSKPRRVQANDDHADIHAGDLDGRGNLSERALSSLCSGFCASVLIRCGYG